MLQTIIALFFSTYLGFLVCFLLVPHVTTAEKLALGYAVGLGILTLGIFVLAATGIPIRASIMIPLALFVLAILTVALFPRLRVGLQPSVGNLGFRAAMLPRQITLTWPLVLLICLIALASLNITIYWPNYAWDSLTEYDFRAKIFLRDENLSILGLDPYYGGIPLQTSLAHTWIYLWGGTTPHIIYWLFYICLLTVFYFRLHDEVGTIQGLVFTTMLAFTPIFVFHSTFAFANLPFAFFCGISALYIYKWSQTMYLNDCLMAGVLIGLGSWLRSGSESFFLVNAVVLLLWCIHKKQYRAIIYYTGVYLFFYMTWKTYQMFFIPTTAQLYEKVLFFEFNPGRAVELLEYLISFLFTQQTYGFVWLLFFVLAIFSLSQGKNRSLLLLCIVVADLICWYAQIYLIHFGTLQAFAKESGERLLMTFMPIALFYSAISPTMRASWRICVSHTRRYWLANRSTVLNRLAVLTAAVAAVIVMVPRLRAPYFGLLDDGMSLQIANRVLAGDYFYPFVVGHPFGRFFPAYWYYYVPQYALWGNNAFGFFLTNCISLVITATALFALVWQISHSRLAGAVAGLLFVLSPPIIETYYTLGKSETQLALYLSLSILCLVLAISRPIRSRLVLFTASAVFLFLSMLTKEASLIMVPITLCWIITYAWYSRGQSDSRAARRLLAWYTVVAVCFAIISRLLAYLTGVAGVSAGTYSQGYGLNGRVILNSLIGHLNLLASDFSYLPWLLIQLAIVVVWARHVLTDSKIHWMIGACVVWVGGWIGILLPWAASVQEYYLLPAALGLSAAAGLGIEMVRRFWLTRSTDRQAPSAAYLASVISLVSALVFIVCSTLNMIGNGSIQLAVDRQNAALINEISHTAPRGATVLFNIRAPHEYVVESVLHLQIIKNRPDLKIDYVSPDSLSHPSDKTLIATMTIRNTPPLSVRVAGYGPTVDRWNGSLLKLLGQHVRTTYHNAEAIPLMLVTNNAWLCPFTMRLHRTVGLISAQRLCPETPMFHAQTMQYGWDLYALQPPQTPHHHSTTIGVFRAQSATWILRNTNGPSGPVRSVPFGQPTDIPIVGDWTSSGHDGIGVFRPATREWFFDSDLDGSTDFAVTWAMMRPGDIPIVGDWDGDGTDTIGFFRPRDSSWHLRNHNSDGPEDIPIFQFGMPGDIPIVGDWNDDGKATIGVYRPSTGQIALKNSNIGSAVDSNFRIQAHQIPITMSWQPYTSAAVATFADGHWSLNYANCECTASDPLAPIEFDFGQHGDMPIAGDWGGQ